MTSRRRFQYQLEIQADLRASISDSSYRRPQFSDLDRLANLMVDAYAGTIDYDGETFADARRQLEGYLQRHPLLQHSIAYTARGAISSACLVGYLEVSSSPLIAYIMTAHAWKRHGLARQALVSALTNLSNAGYERVMATITEGNTASERLFTSVGFKRLPLK